MQIENEQTSRDKRSRHFEIRAALTFNDAHSCINVNFRRGGLYEVTLILGGRECSTHRAYLRAFSNFLKAMFRGGIKERYENWITLKAYLTDAFVKVMCLLYMGMFTPSSFTEFYDVYSCVEFCGTNMVKSTVYKVCKVMTKQADYAFNDSSVLWKKRFIFPEFQEIRREAHCFLTECLEELIASRDMFSLDYLDFSVVLSKLNSAVRPNSVSSK